MIFDIFDANSTSKCLACRTVYIMGISTARQIAFSLLSLMGDESIDRSLQKSLCPRDGISGCDMEVNGVKIKFKY
jgi:hypothetical protein